MNARIRLFCLGTLVAGSLLYRPADAQGVAGPPVVNPAAAQPGTPATPANATPAPQPAAVPQPPAAVPAPEAAAPITPTPDPALVERTAPPATPDPVPAAAPLPAPAPVAAAAEAPAPPPPPPAAPVAITSGQLIDRAWSLLTDNAAAGKNPNDRIQALGALASMGSDERASRLISDAFTSKDVDTRLAAILAAVQTRNPRLIPRVREAMDDPDPQVAFTAASALWKAKDYAGENMLAAIAEGDRKASESLFGGAKHKGQQELHDPKLMATQGLEAGAGFFLGPAGFGIKAIMYARGQGGAAARAQAVTMLSERQDELAHRTLKDCLNDKESTVRAACAKGLGNWPGAETAHLVAPLMEDNKLSVKLCAAATYIRALHPVGKSREYAEVVDPKGASN